MAKKNKIKRVLVTFAIVMIGISAVFVIGLQMKLKGFSKEVSKIEIQHVDLSTVKDGVYTGEYHMNEAVGAAVKVTVENGEIKNIDILEHNCGLGKKAEAITGSVIMAQTTKVDTVSGATGSSTVILKAIEDALNQGVSK